MRAISIKLPDDLYHQMTVAQGQHLMNVSQFIREAIQCFLKQAGSALQEPSFLDMAHDLCGVATLPSDLSTHPKHMEGFGQ